MSDLMIEEKMTLFSLRSTRGLERRVRRNIKSAAKKEHEIKEHFEKLRKAYALGYIEDITEELKAMKNTIRDIVQYEEKSEEDVESVEKSLPSTFTSSRNP